MEDVAKSILQNKIAKLKKKVMQVLCPVNSKVEFIEIESERKEEKTEAIVFRDKEKLSVQVLRDVVCFNFLEQNLDEIREDEILNTAKNILERHMRVEDNEK